MQGCPQRHTGQGRGACARLKTHGVVGEEHAKHVPDLPLVPGSRGVDMRDRLHRRHLVHQALHADTAVVPDAQQVVDELESLRPLREIYRGHVRHDLVLSYPIQAKGSDTDELVRQTSSGSDGGGSDASRERTWQLVWSRRNVITCVIAGVVTTMHSSPLATWTESIIVGRVSASHWP